jgi:glycosyltransferase involved in cell wall biosynthesis
MPTAERKRARPPLETGPATRSEGPPPPERTPRVSVVLPCLDEAGNLVRLLDELREALARVGQPFEIVCVDDGSTDGTLEVLAAQARTDPALVVLRHARNCGQSAAFATGFRRARGELLITMDSDGQNDPADIPRLLAALEGADAVCGVRRRRQDDWVRRVSSRIGNGVRDLLTGIKVADAGCAFRVLRRGALDELPVFNGMHRFLPTILRLQGLEVREVEVGHRARTAGVSKYGIGNRALRGLVDCLAMRWYRRRVLPARRVAAGPSASERPAP